jgi:ABC-type transport system involved in cytochrome bd biosynthesis fused ATPase/permease subunit
MSDQKKSPFPLAIVLGIAGMIAGIFLLFGESWFIGLFGFIASAGVAYRGYQDTRS